MYPSASLGRHDSRQSKKEKRLQAQAKALERIEFGLENMGLSALGIPATRRKAIEEQINRGIVLPPTAELLGISIDKRTTADKAMPQIEDAMRANSTRKDNQGYMTSSMTEFSFLMKKASLPTQAVRLLPMKPRCRSLTVCVRSAFPG
jgi:hypothetical protein